MIRFECRLARADFRFDVAFEAGSGITALFGPSGSGKSTAIRLVAGLERPDQGRISLGDAVLVDTAGRRFLPPHRRRVGLVFQDAQLFPHLSVRANLGYGRFFTPRPARRIGFDPVVEVLGIGHLLARRPSTLSGGEHQRVAIGRTLLASPDLLAMDEPLAALDAARKQEILPFIERLRDEFAIPILYVSHSVEEVARLAAAVVRIEAGRVVAIGSPAAVLGATAIGHPADRFDVVSMISGANPRFDPDFCVTRFDHPAGPVVVPGRVAPPPGAVRIAIRATNVALALGRPADVSIRTMLSARVVAIAGDAGPLALVTLALNGGEPLSVYATRLAIHDLGLTPGQPVTALVKAVAIDESAVPGAGA